VLNYALPAGFNLSAHWDFASGAPYTGILGSYRHWYYSNEDHQIEYVWIDVMSAKNGVRYPDYHRLDLGLSRSFRIGRTRLDAEAQVINVYDRKNLLLYYTLTYQAACRSDKQPTSCRSCRPLPCAGILMTRILVISLASRYSLPDTD